MPIKEGTPSQETHLKYVQKKVTEVSVLLQRAILH